MAWICEDLRDTFSSNEDEAALFWEAGLLLVNAQIPGST